MSPSVNLSDPRSTAAAAMLLAGELAPLVREPVPVLLGHSSPEGLTALAERLEGEAIFDRAMRAELRDVIAEIEDAVERETASAFEWVPVRCIDGAEEFERIVRKVRTRHGDALAAVGDRFGALLALVARTEALLAAERFVRRRL